MKQILPIVISLVLTSCSQPSEQIVSRQDDQKLPDCIQEFIGQNDSIATIDTVDFNGTMEVSYFISHLYPDGNLKRLSVYHDCKKYGVERAFYQSGKLKYKRDYNGDLLVEVFEHYDSQGDSLYPGDVKDYQGRFIDYYDSGTKRKEGEIKNGLPSGLWTFYHPNGKIESEVTYLNERLNDDQMIYGVHGMMKGYDTSGNLTIVHKVDSNQVVYVWEYDTTGNVTNEHPMNKTLNFKFEK